jgi:hypothetical protein
MTCVFSAAQPLKGPLNKMLSSDPTGNAAKNCANHFRSLLDYDGKADLVAKLVAKALKHDATSKSAAFAEDTSEQKSQFESSDKLFGTFFASVLNGGSAVSMEVRF